MQHDPWRRRLAGLIVVLLAAGICFPVAGCHSKAPQSDQVESSPATAGSSTGSSPPVREPGYPFNANLPQGHPHAWRQRPAAKPRQSFPLSEKERELESFVQAFNGRLRKSSRRTTLDSRINNAVAGESLLSVDLAYCQAFGKLREMPLLEEIVALDLSRTDMNDKDLKDLARARNLVQLDLTYARVTDEGILELAGLPNLRLVILFHTATTPQGIARLKELNPNLHVQHHGQPASRDSDMVPPAGR